MASDSAISNAVATKEKEGSKTMHKIKIIINLLNILLTSLSLFKFEENIASKSTVFLVLLADK